MRVPTGWPASLALELRSGSMRAGRRVVSPAASDDELLALVARQDADALAALYDRHRSVAYGVALRVTGSVAIAEDVLQDAFLGAWRQASAFDPSRGSGRSWLLAIVHHRAVDAVRRRRDTDALPEADAPAPAQLVAPDVWPEVAGRLDGAAVRRALDTLSAPQRQAIELAYWGGLTQAEIAEREGLPLGTVKGRMRLGLLALARELRGTVDPGEGGLQDAGAAGASDLGRPAAGPTGRLRALAARLRERIAGKPGVKRVWGMLV